MAHPTRRLREWRLDSRQRELLSFRVTLIARAIAPQIMTIKPQITA